MPFALSALCRVNAGLSSNRSSSFSDAFLFISIYSGKASEEELTQYYKKAADLWKAIGTFLSGAFSKSLADKPTSGPFYGGEKPGEADCASCVTVLRLQLSFVVSL